jgi:glycosyltransferase involved in cell wall biosynthesis
MATPGSGGSASGLRVALTVSDFEDGGVERNFVNLALGLDRLGVQTWLLAGNPRHPYLRDLEGSAVRVLPVGGDRGAAIASFLAREAPDILMTGKLADDFAAFAARSAFPAQARPPTRLLTAVGTLLSGRFAAHPWNPIKRFRDIRRIGACYRGIDGISAISQGVAEDLRRVFGVLATPIRVLPNPIVPETIDRLASAPVGHPWLETIPPRGPAAGRPPVIVAVGGLRKVKDFASLLRAFAQLHDPAARLIVLGEGKERGRLEQLARHLRVVERVDLPGFVPNPHAFVARSRLLVLSSRREGLGNAVVEALAVGTPVVVTDCSHGLRQLLAGGEVGRMVAIGDPAVLARGIAAELGTVRDAERLMAAARPYGLMAAARAHRDFFDSLLGRRSGDAD